MSTASSSSAAPELRRAAARVHATCTCFALRRAARAVAQQYDAALRPAGLRNTQFTLLAVLAGQGALSVQALADASGTDRTTLTRNVAVLERERLVSTRAAEDDGRSRLVDLTALGQARLRAALPLWERVQAELAAGIGRDDLAALRAGLEHTIDAAAMPTG